MTKTVRKRRMKVALSTHYQMAAHLCPQLHQASFSRLVVLSLLLCSFTVSQSASVDTVRNTNNNHHNIQFRNRIERRIAHPQQDYHQPTYFVNQHNEYESRVSILDDDTLRLSLAIDDDSHLGGLSAPSLHLIEPKVYLRVSGESGMIRPANKDNEVLSSRTSSQKVEPRARELHEDDHEIEEDEETETEDDDMNDNYHHHFPYIESYREKYTKPDLHHPSATSSTEDDSSSSIEAPASTKPKQVWSEIIAQVTTPSSFNEINSSASEHRLADFHFRANLPSYFYNKYSSYSEEDLENVADFDDDHSKYFVKTKPRSVTASGSNIYSNFYYEPPSFSTKSVPIPVKTDRKQFVFASAKPPTNNHDEEGSQHLYVDDHEEDAISHSHNHEDDHELPQQDASIMTTTLPNFTTPQKPNDAEGSSSKIQIDQINASNRPLDATTSQSILSKVIINDPDSGTTPQYEEKSETTTTTTFLSSTTTEATTTTTDATSIPGVPGIDYPILDEIPQTGFDCKNQRYKGFFADIDTKCQAWHYCDFTDGHSTFLCPNGTLFSQVLLTCDWWFNVDCDQARQLYVLNERLYRYIKPPKPSFPEDFTGEHVDKWLIQQLQMGLLPKVRKKSKAKHATLPPPRPTSSSATPSPKHK